MISPFAGISGFRSASSFGRGQDSRVLQNPGARMELQWGHDFSAMDRAIPGLVAHVMGVTKDYQPFGGRLRPWMWWH